MSLNIITRVIVVFPARRVRSLQLLTSDGSCGVVADGVAYYFEIFFIIGVLVALEADLGLGASPDAAGVAAVAPGHYWEAAFGAEGRDLD